MCTIEVFRSIIAITPSQRRSKRSYGKDRALAEAGSWRAFLFDSRDQRRGNPADAATMK